MKSEKGVYSQCHTVRYCKDMQESAFLVINGVSQATVPALNFLLPLAKLVLWGCASALNLC